MSHQAAPTNLGFACSCGKKYLKEELFNEHLAQEKNVEEPEIVQTVLAMGGELVEEPKETKKAVAKAEDKPKPLLPVQRIQADVIRYTTKLLGEKRAHEFATRVALIARENTKLGQSIVSNPDSFLAAYLASATLNLMPNTPEQLAFVIPYGDKVQFQTGYRGLIQLARRSGEIKTISAELVFEGDDFKAQFGTDRKITHIPDFNVNRTDYKLVTHAYGAATLTNGETQFVVMTRDELNKIQKTAKASSGDSPWQQWPERMALKTVLKRLTQVLPTSTDDDLRKAVAYDNLSEAGKLHMDKESGDIIEGEVIEVPQAAIEAINSATTKEEVSEVLQGLPVAERKKAAPIASARLKELV